MGGRRIASICCLVAFAATAAPALPFTPDRVGLRVSNGTPSMVPTSSSSFVDRDVVSAGEVAIHTAGGTIGGGLVVIAGLFMFRPCRVAWDDLWSSTYRGVKYYCPREEKAFEYATMIIFPSLAIPAATSGGIAFAGRDWTGYANSIVGSYATALAGGAIGYGIARIFHQPGRGIAVGWTLGSLAGGVVGYNWDRLR